MRVPNRPSRRLTAALSLLMLGGVVAACTKEDAPATDTAAAMPAAEVPAAAPPAIDDAQIAHIVVTANAIDSAIGTMAESKATNADVKAFARMMATDHGGVNLQAVALATRLGVTPADNDVSRSLRQGETQSRDSLGALAGAAFDRAYIDREVAYHQAVIGVLDERLVPGAQNADLKKLLQDSRPAFEAHLARAKTLQASLGAH